MRSSPGSPNSTPRNPERRNRPVELYVATATVGTTGRLRRLPAPKVCGPMDLSPQCNAGLFFGLEDCRRRRVCQSITTCHWWMPPAARGSGGPGRSSLTYPSSPSSSSSSLLTTDAVNLSKSSSFSSQTRSSTMTMWSGSSVAGITTVCDLSSPRSTAMVT